MAKTLDEKVREILDSSDYNELPYEERVRIGKYKAHTQILTLWQILHKYSEDITPAYKRKVKAWC